MISELKDRIQMRESRIRHALRDQLNNGRVLPCDEVFMLNMLDRGLIGMDGFKFCEVIEAQRNRAVFLKSSEGWTSKNALGTGYKVSQDRWVGSDVRSSE